MLDAKAEVDVQLRGAINEFKGQFVARITSSIDTKNAKGVQKFEKGEAANRASRVRTAISNETPFLRSKLEEYFTDPRTRETLVAAVMESVTEAYEAWFNTVYTPSLQANGTGRSSSGKGKGREDDVWDPDVFNEWCAGVFKVGTLGLGIMGGEDEDVEDRDRGMDHDDYYDDSGSEGNSVSVGTGRGTERTGRTGIRINM